MIVMGIMIAPMVKQRGGKKKSTRGHDAVSKPRLKWHVGQVGCRSSALSFFGKVTVPPFRSRAGASAM
jgi:hypothetical protein